MSEAWWTCRCVRVASDVVDAEIARIVSTVSPDATVLVERERRPDPVVEITIQNGAGVRDEVARSLGGLVWFQTGNTSEDVDITSLHCDGARVFKIVRCALLAIDQVEITPGALELAPTSLADVLDPGAWILRLATERYGADFTRISGRDLGPADHEETPGTGPERPQRTSTFEPDAAPSGRDGETLESSLPDDIPF